MAKRQTPKQKELYSKLTTLQKHTANAFILGKTATASYRIACKKLKRKPAKNARSAANQLLTNSDVKAYVDSVKLPNEEKEANNAIMTREEILQSFSREAKGSIARLMQFREGVVGFEDDEANTPIIGTMMYFKDSDQISQEDLDLISEISVSAKGVIKIKLENRQNAKKQLNLMEGYEAVQKYDHTSNGKPITPISPTVDPVAAAKAYEEMTKG